MNQPLIKFGVLGAVSLAAGLYFKFTTASKPTEKPTPSDDKCIQDIIKDILLRIMTKQNMAIVQDLYTLDCLQMQKLIQPYEYTLKTGGKKIRLVMAVVVSELFTSGNNQAQVPKQVIQVGGLIELLHSASLIIDDIEDGSLQRRGEPCSYLVHGLDRSINAANFIYFLPFRNLLQSIESPQKKLEVLKIFIEEMTVCHLGQAQDIIVHKAKSSQQLPVLEQYETLTIAKTSSLLRMMVKMLCVFLGRSNKESQKLCEVMNYVGLAFQVTDDVLNLTKNLGKGGLAEDLKEKKFTPIINLMRENQEFMALFLQNIKDDKMIGRMLELIMQTNAIEETKKLAKSYEEKALSLIENLETPYSKSHFRKLMRFIITRQN